MSLDRRMADESRLKARELQKAKVMGDDLSGNPRALGRQYSTHGTQCSCWMCGNPRKHFKSRSLDELRQEQSDD